MESTLPQAAFTALINISLAWIAGVLTSRLWLAHGKDPWQQAASKRLAPAMSVGLLTAIAGVFLSLWTESAVMGDVPWLNAWPACKEMLASTHYGHAGVAAMAILAVAMLMHWRLVSATSSLKYVTVMTVLLMLVAVARVTIGHAFEHGLLHPAMWIEWLHLMLMSVWVGVVLVAGWLVLPMAATREPIPASAHALYLHAMSNWAAASAAGILATGIYNAFRVLSSPRDLIAGDYGSILLFKIVLVVVAIALGGYNKFFGLPAAVSSASADTARRGMRTVIAVLRLESIALLLVLACAAVLTASAPPGQ